MITQKTALATILTVAVIALVLDRLMHQILPLLAVGELYVLQ